MLVYVNQHSGLDSMLEYAQWLRAKVSRRQRTKSKW